ncbi:hypothetical protein EDB85DRAFT_451957 [Lactarius pseudohatsudake]|nr:hypothetical protein EDB85DRAFT_451957 [Lactarius pseudohatsudake]
MRHSNLWPLRQALQLRSGRRLLHLYLTLLTAPNQTSARDDVDLVVFMVVLNQEQKPVLFAEIKDDRWANEPYTRQRADTQMPQLYEQMLPNSAIPHLYGLSLLGTSLRVYRGDKVTGTITPHPGRPHADRIFPPDFLKGQGDLDILSPDGLKKSLRISRRKPPMLWGSEVT